MLSRTCPTCGSELRLQKRDRWEVRCTKRGCSFREEAVDVNLREAGVAPLFGVSDDE